MDIARLLELVEDVALDSIYCHTPSFYLRHAHPQTSYPNDFATWAAWCVGPLRYLSLEGLRQEIIAIIDHLSSPPYSLSRVHRHLPAGEAFYIKRLLNEPERIGAIGRKRMVPHVE